MRARRAAVSNASAVKHFVARGVVDLAASVSDAPSSPAAWWSVRPWVPLLPPMSLRPGMFASVRALKSRCCWRLWLAVLLSRA